MHQKPTLEPAYIYQSLSCSYLTVGTQGYHHIWYRFSISRYTCICICILVSDQYILAYISILYPLIYFSISWHIFSILPKVAVYPGISSGCLRKPTIYTFLPLEVSSCQNQISLRPHNLNFPKYPFYCPTTPFCNLILKIPLF